MKLRPEEPPAGPWRVQPLTDFASTELVLVEGVGAGRAELAPLFDANVWVQSDAAEAKRRGIERDGGDERAASFWDHWEAEEAPFFMRDRPWERADTVVAGGQVLPHARSTEVVVAPPPRE